MDRGTWRATVHEVAESDLAFSTLLEAIKLLIVAPRNPFEVNFIS